jgi:outer membrane protein OmpA-like peptidoglycan-associated protein
MADSVKGRIKLQIFRCFCVMTVIVFAASCAPNLAMQKQAEDVVGKAGQYLGAAKKVKAGEKYPDQFEKARKDYEIAKDFLEKQKAEQAIQSAENSLKTSEILLRQYYREEIIPNAEKLRKAIKEKVGDDIDNPLNDQIPDLEGILSRAKEVETMKGAVAIDLVLDSTRKFLIAGDSLESITTEELKSDVSFDIGKYELSDEGRVALEAFAGNIIAGKNRYKEKYPDDTIVIKSKIVGYTDQIGFDEKKPLFKELSSGIEDRIPTQQPERRQFLNKRLAEFRARAISSHIEEFIKKGEESRLKITPEIIGKGEDIPPGVAEPYPTNDPRRRVCKIYNFMVRE